MATIIEMPKLSDTMSVGTIANWLKKEGDAVASGDVIAEIETDKATMELEAFEDGVLLKHFAKAGEQVALGKPIAAIGEKGEKVEVPEETGGEEEAQAKEAPQEEKEEKAEKGEEEEAKEEKAEEAEKPEESEEKREEPEPAAPDEGGGRIKASPLARKVAQEEGIDLTRVKGTGPGGRIVREDVLAAKRGGGAPAAAAGKGAPAQPTGEPAEDKEWRVSNMRATIARRLVESKREVPHFYLEMEVDAAPLLALRQSLNDELAELPPEQGGGVKFTVNDFILKASVEAIRREPPMNRSWQGETIRQSGATHIAFGVAIEDGLLTPVIRDADRKSLRQIALEARELIDKARSKKLNPDQLTGSTFTVTNLGMFGIASFYGIINPPNAGILSVGATQARPVVGPDGAIAAGQIMKIGLSGDHRSIDGAVGARFLQALKRILETRL